MPIVIDHPARGRLNAWLLDSIDGYMHETYGALKTRLFGTLPPVVVELGPGTGANFRYYSPGTQVIAIEPNLRMHPRLRRKAAQHALKLDVRTRGAESIDLPDKSFNFICATMLLCSVKDPAAVLAEVHRVLSPGGRFVCIEHVQAPANHPGLRRLQRAIRGPWRWLLEGCNLCNQTERALRAAGFRELQIEQLEVPNTLPPIRYQIAASCTA